MKAVVLLSGGIDSPVAAYVMAKAGVNLSALHMDNLPFCDARKPVVKIIEQLKEVTGQDIPLYVAPHGQVNLEQISKTRNKHIRCVLCKRFMMRVAEALAKKIGFDAIVMGDSLGQVASQTLRNMLVEQESVHTPIIRPLVGYDKEEIIKISKDIGTFEYSIMNIGVCQIIPDKPSTLARVDRVREAEAEMDVEAMISQCMDKMEKQR